MGLVVFLFFFFFFNDTATTEIYTLSLHDALPISCEAGSSPMLTSNWKNRLHKRSEEHTSELQSRLHLVCRLLLEKKKTTKIKSLTNKCTSNTEHQTNNKTTA